MSEARSETPLPRRWPALRILAAVRMAFDIRKMTLATIGLILLGLGWSTLDRLFPHSAAVTPDLGPPPFLGWVIFADEWRDLILGRLGQPFLALATSMMAFFDPSSGWATMGHALLAIAWLVIVWGPIGVAIARIAAIQASQSRQVGIGEAVHFARHAGLSMIFAMLYPMVVIALFSLSGLALGWLYRVPGGDALAGILLFIPLLCGLVIALLAALMLVGWPMFPAAIATGAENALDTLSRTYSYFQQRLVMFVVGVVIAAVAGVIGLFLVDLLTWAVFRFASWSLTLDGPPDRVLGLFAMDHDGSNSLATGAHWFWLEAVRLVAHAWVYSYFWTAATMAYLGLRQDTDGTPTDVIDPPGSPV